MTRSKASGGRAEDRKCAVKDFRDFASLLLQNSKYRSYQPAWLGHAPNTVAAEFYSGEEDVFDLYGGLYCGTGLARFYI